MLKFSNLVNSLTFLHYTYCESQTYTGRIMYRWRCSSYHHHHNHHRHHHHYPNHHHHHHPVSRCGRTVSAMHARGLWRPDCVTETELQSGDSPRLLRDGQQKHGRNNNAGGVQPLHTRSVSTTHTVSTHYTHGQHPLHTRSAPTTHTVST
jgi:hypothetical protein